MAPNYLLRVLGLAVLAAPAWAVTSISDAQMSKYLVAGGGDLAYAYAPIWFFGESQGQVPCIPDWAFGGSPSTKDIYDSAHLTKPVPRCQYPDVGCHCRNPGVPRGQAAPPFPTYYTYEKCSDGEVRVAYNLFYQKDGAKVAFYDTGHDWDWERVIVIHSRDSKTKKWAPSEALYSAHSGYNKYKWGDIQNTLTTKEVEAGDAKTPNGVKNQDHPKVYVGWSKHPNFDDRNTGFNGVAAQSLGIAFRSQDWWYFVARKYFLRCDSSTACGKAMAKVDWGEADSDPPRVQSGICSAGN